MSGCVFLSHVSLDPPTGGTPRKAVTIVLCPKSLALHNLYSTVGGTLQWNWYVEYMWNICGTLWNMCVNECRASPAKGTLARWPITTTRRCSLQSFGLFCCEALSVLCLQIQSFPSVSWDHEIFNVWLTTRVTCLLWSAFSEMFRRRCGLPVAHGRGWRWWRDRGSCCDQIIPGTAAPSLTIPFPKFSSPDVLEELENCLVQLPMACEDTTWLRWLRVLLFFLILLGRAWIQQCSIEPCTILLDAMLKYLMQIAFIEVQSPLRAEFDEESIQKEFWGDDSKQKNSLTWLSVLFLHYLAQCAIHTVWRVFGSSLRRVEMTVSQIVQRKIDACPILIRI